MATRFDIRRQVRFGHEVSELAFDEAAGVWTATTKNRKRFRARTVVLASGPLSDVEFPGHARPGQLSRAQDPQRPLGSRLRLHRQAGRRHRHRRQRGPDHSRTGEAGRLRQGVPAHAGLGAAAPGRRHATGVAGRVRQSACHPTACPPAPVLGPRSHRNRYGVEHPADLAGGPAGRSPYPHAGQRPLVAPPIDPGLRAGLQTHAGIQRLLPRVAAGQLQTRRLADRDAEPRRHPHQRRDRAPPGLHRVRHRIRRPPDRAAASR